jgi:hypothetical protein
MPVALPQERPEFDIIQTLFAAIRIAALADAQ